MKYFTTHFAITGEDSSLMQAARDLCSDIAGECGYETFVETEEGVDGYIQIDNYDESLLRESLSDFPLEGFSIDFTTEEVEDQDWNETWEEEEGFEPITIAGDALLIYDLHHITEDELSHRPEHIKIGIEARNAFGTGTHETTQMMAESILATPLYEKRILDCGCGTGILAITALRSGAKEAVAYDIDEWSVENTRHNAELNGVGDSITVYEGDANILSHVDGVFDLVVANINRNILLNDLPAFHEVMNSGATLLLSGFYEEDIPLLTEKAESLGLKLTEKKENGDWRCLRFTF